MTMERQTNAVSMLTRNGLLKCQTEKSDNDQIPRRPCYRSRSISVCITDLVSSPLVPDSTREKQVTSQLACTCM